MEKRILEKVEIQGDTLQNIQYELSTVYNREDIFFENPFDLILKTNNECITRPRIGISLGTFDINIIEKYNLSATKNLLLALAKKHSTKNLVLINSWLTNMLPGTHADLHAHNPSFLYGVYYYDVQEEDTPIIFEDDGMYQSIPPRIGLLLLWPGHLKHKIDTKTLNCRRQSLSFNIMEIE